MKNIYDGDFFQSEGKRALSSAEIIIPYIIDRLECESVVDFGCGTGQWLNVIKKHNKNISVLGIDGAYAKHFNQLSANEFIECDLTKEINLDRKFSLAISLEVAEHLHEDFSDAFIKNLVLHSDIVLFSAAIPFQGGTHHVNEQYPSYWVEKFKKYGYVLCDCIRNIFWNDPRIEFFYKQNMFFYCKEEFAQSLLVKFRNNDNNCLNLIHPDLWIRRNLKQFFFPFSLVNKDSKIIIYGAGSVGKAFLNQVLATKYCDCVMICDSSWNSYEESIGGLNVSNPADISSVNYDYIIIAVEKESVANQIKSNLKDIVGDSDLIIWKNPVWNRIY